MPKRRRKLYYSGKKYSNPFFRQKKKNGVLSFAKKKSKRERSRRFKLAIFLFAAAVAGFVWLFCFSAAFNIVSVEVAGNDKISADKIKNLVWRQTEERRLFFLSQRKLFLFDKDELARRLNDEYFFQNLSIKKKFPDTLIITLKEKEYAAAWYELGKYYHIDNEGNVLSETDPLQINRQNYPLIENDRREKIKDGKVNGSRDQIDFIISLFKIAKNDKNFQIDRFALTETINGVQDADTVIMKTVGGPDIYFSVNSDAKEQMSKLAIILEKTLKDNFKDKQYIDLRYGDRVYYK